MEMNDIPIERRLDLYFFNRKDLNALIRNELSKLRVIFLEIPFNAN